MPRHALLLVVIACSAAFAGDLTWRNVGPGGGGWIQALACDPRDPDTLYLGCDVGGFYLSHDAGKTWTIHNEGLTDYFVQCLAVHPKDSRTLLLGSEGGIFRSTDGGLTWQRQGQGFPPRQRYAYSAPIGALAFDPTRPDTVYAGIGRPRWGKSGVGQIYRSRDCGTTWQLVTPSGVLDPKALVCDLDVAPDGSAVLATTDQGLYRSTDQGDTWQRVTAGLPHSSLQRLAFAPSQPNVVYCTLRTLARGGAPWDGGVCRSEDGGQTWTACREGLPTRVGKTGEPAQMTSNLRELVVDPRDANVVYTGDWAWVSAGIYKTSDGGKHWARATQHVGAGKNMDYGWITQWGPAVECLALSAARPDRLVLGTSGHVFLTDDAGATWQQRYCRTFPDGRFAGNGLEVTCFNSLTADPTDPQRLYFGYMDIGLLLSTDGGASYRASNQGMKYRGNCFRVVLDPADPNKLWAGTGEWGSNHGDLCRSTDRGATWTVVGNPASGLPDGQTRHLFVDPTSPAGRRTLLVTSNRNGVFRSTDDGLTWQACNTGLPEMAKVEPRRLLADPQDPKHLLVALGGAPQSGAGLYETRDQGGTWQRLKAQLAGQENAVGFVSDVQDLVAGNDGFGTLYLCQRERYEGSAQPPVMFPGGLFRSRDGGQTWERLHDYHFCRTVVVSPADPQVLYLATTDHPYHDDSRALGVLKSRDGGKTWQQEVEGLSLWNVVCLAVAPGQPWRLYAGTGGNGGFIGEDRQFAPK